MGVTLFLTACADAEKTEMTAPLRQVRSILVGVSSDVFQRSFSGTLHSSNEISYSFKVHGTVEEIKVDVGQAVKKGDVIAIIDPSDYELEVQKAVANLNEANSEYRKAQADYARTKKLYEAGNSSRSDLDNARAAAETAAASTQSFKKSLQIAQQNVSYTKMKSQSDCKIASIPVSSGENISQGAKVITAECGDDLEVKLDVPESTILSIKKGMPVNVSFSALEGKVYKGIVNEVAVSSVEGGTTFPVTVVMDSSNLDGLKAGLSADVLFEISNGNKTGKSAPIIPSFAISEDQSGQFVYLVKPTEGDRATVQKQAVKVGGVMSNGIEVIEGLEPGERIVTAGVSVLRDGMEVKYSGER